MISYLRGRIVRKSPTELVIDVNGVGYALSIPLSTYTAFEDAAGEVTVLTHLHVREDIQQLYGFATDGERDFFRLLISISGIGPKMAQGILSGMGIEELRQSILQADTAKLTSVPGVGRKTAERIIIELRDKVAKPDSPEPAALLTSPQLKVRAEAIVALMSLGYTRQNAEKALSAVLTDPASRLLSVEELIRTSLRSASR